MPEIFGIPSQALFGQLLIGLINGSFYALLSLGLAVIFGLLNIINFTHGAQYMLGAFVAWMLLHYLGIGYWWALILAPVIVGATGIVIERLMISRLYHLDHLYGLLLTFGLALIIQGLFRNEYGISGGDNLVAVNNVFTRHPGFALKNVDASSQTAHNQFHENGGVYSGSNLDAATSFDGDPMLELQRANDDLDSFAHVVSHDLRAPLRTMSGFSRILIDDYGPHLDPRGRRLLSVRSSMRSTRTSKRASRSGRPAASLLTASGWSTSPAVRASTPMPSAPGEPR